MQTTPPAEVRTEVPITEPIKAPAKATPLAKNNRPTPAKVPSSDTRDEDVAADETRSANAVANLKLSEVKKIYIEIRGDAALRSNLIESLGSSGVVVPTTNADEADAALKIVVSQTRTSARLVNARGTILWSKTGRSVSELIKDLLSDIRLARTGH